MWFMNGAKVAGEQALSVAPDISWNVAGVGDFDGDGDGRAGMMWRQGSTGSVAIWLMNGSNITSSNDATYQGNKITPDASWSIVEAGDFNGDGKTDLLWRQTGSGTLAEWLMDGSQISSSQLIGAAPDDTWQAQSKPTNYAV